MIDRRGPASLAHHGWFFLGGCAVRIGYAVAVVVGMTMVGGEAGAVSLYGLSYRGAPMTVTEVSVEVIGPDGLEMQSVPASRAKLPAYSGFAFDLIIDERKLPSRSLVNATSYFRFGSSNYLGDEAPIRAGLVDYAGVGDPAFDDSEPDFATWISLTTGVSREVVDYRISVVRTLGESGDSGGTVTPSGDSYLEKIDSVRRIPGLENFAGGSAYVTWGSDVAGTWEVAPVPTPAGLGLIASGVAALGFLGRFRRRG